MSKIFTGEKEVDFSSLVGEDGNDEEPFALFSAWMEEARRAENIDPEACALASTDAQGLPNVRMVLVRNADIRGFVFHTNLKSVKGEELRTNPNAALCFHWKSLQRQVRVRGKVSLLLDKEADAYFASRPRGSRIGAWASMQSQPLEGRFELEKRVAEYSVRYGVGEIPRPSFWSGFRLYPSYIEFWRQGMFRLHERLVFRRYGEERSWRKEMLFP